MSNRNIVIVEGPDFRGKSTLCEYLAGTLPGSWRVQHTGGPLSGAGDFYARHVEMLSIPGPVIFDRCPHISGQVYESAFYGRPVFSPELHTSLFLLAQLSPHIIFCLPQCSKKIPKEKFLERQKNKAHKTLDYALKVFEKQEEIEAFYWGIVCKMPALISLGAPITYEIYDWESTPIYEGKLVKENL